MIWIYRCTYMESSGYMCSKYQSIWWSKMIWIYNLHQFTSIHKRSKLPGFRPKFFTSQHRGIEVLNIEKPPAIQINFLVQRIRRKASCLDGKYEKMVHIVHFSLEPIQLSHRNESDPISSLRCWPHVAPTVGKECGLFVQRQVAATMPSLWPPE